jgi:hypothetical protein
VVAITPLGYPARAGLNRPLEDRLRKDEAEIFSMERY